MAEDFVDVVKWAIYCILVGTAQSQENVDPGEPLFLTPLIQAGEIGKAMEVSLVKDFYPNITSYSGFITVNEEYNSNMYFWYFPAKENPEIAPVILWSDGGPGISGFFSVLSQNGPFLAKGSNNISLNPHSWNSKYHMIYMDNPVEVGFSFTDNKDGYIVSGDEAARDIFFFLQQFFKMFPHLQSNPFYNGGASYGATYAINAAYYIHLQNQGNKFKSREVRINLTGVIVDSPWIDPHTQFEYAASLYNFGLIDEPTRDNFTIRQNEMRSLIDAENYVDAFQVWKQLTQLDAFMVTGYGAINNMYNDQPEFVDVTPFVIQNATRKALHVGNLRFLFVNPEQQSRMHPHMLRSAKPQLETLLTEGYRWMTYIGNMDASTGHLGVTKLIKSLKWDGANELLTGKRSVWKVGGRVAGYATSSAQNATLVLVRNSGHGCLTDQPEWVLNAVDKFIGGKDFSAV